ncbi:MAG TPA: ABC transporter ATP-binding protein, partial [Cyclobacteriaceae bacterium]|nr:ABC transporter ATP-binding protein [Cyclobacteriaceae bacterium]
INFEIKRGDRVGIIGRNGAGKSTLLKVLSRITEPTSGKISIHGRVASLLEVGTGFHPELTGRENIFLNGAILGMSRAEIKRKFDEIVAFAEIERFLDTPVKRYSSGMYVRLAFAVAAHLEPEILIVDEVLAVGDAQFQRKCLGKMEDVSKNEGRTVLFVSHNMIAIQNLCNDIILMNKGEMIYHGERAKGMIQYERLNREIAANKSRGSEETFIRFFVQTTDEINPESITGNQKLTFKIDIEAHRDYGKSWVNISIDNNEGTTIGHIRNDWYDYSINVDKGKKTIEVTVEDISLAPGVYNFWTRVVLSEEAKIFDSDPIPIEVKGKHLYGNIAYKTQWNITEKI